ncbi:MAG: antibiotic biosynthesis monooxygenase [Dehalococcoidia bacterium]
MTYFRVSICKPRRGQDKHLLEVMTKVSDLAKNNPGCLESYILKPHDESGEIARITIYEDEHAAEVRANTDTMLALRSEIHLAAESHVERAFFTV